MKRIAVLALVAALGASTATAQEIAPVTSSQASLALLGGLGAGAAVFTVVIVATIAGAVAAANDSASGT